MRAASCMGKDRGREVTRRGAVSVSDERLHGGGERERERKHRVHERAGKRNWVYTKRARGLAESEICR